MTKIFNKDSIIYLDGFVYIVDNKEHCEKGDYYYNPVTKEIKQALSGKINANKIVATNNPSLKGVPKLQISDGSSKDQLVGQSYIELRETSPSQWPRILARLWDAASKKKYSEEDMRKAFDSGAQAGLGKNVSFETLIQPLTRKIKEIELETSPKPFDDQFVIDKGYVIVRRVEYE